MDEGDFMKQLKWIIPLLFIVAVGCTLIYGYIARNVEASQLDPISITEKDGFVHVKGDFKDENTRYAGYNYTIVDGKMILSIKAAYFTGKKGGYDFKIREENASSIKEITIRGKNEEDEIVVPVK